jgi:DNA modification methylase
LGRDWLGIELNPAYVAMAWQRLGKLGRQRLAA